MYDIVIVGGGVIGASIFRELTKYNLKILVLEKESDVASGTTKANSAIIHAGFDPKENTLMAKVNVAGSKMFKDLCQELDVPYKNNGSLVLAFSSEEMLEINRLYNNGINLGVENLEIIDKERVLNLEPNISDKVIGALYAPTGGIVCPFEYTIALIENAIVNGGEIQVNSEVVGIKKNNDYFTIKIKGQDKEIESKIIINAAGVYSDKIHNMICKEDFKIIPRKGEYYVLDKTSGKIFNHTLFQCPSKLGKGTLVTPTVHGNLLIGPNALDIDDREDVSTTKEGLDNIKLVAEKTTEKIDFNAVIRTFAGLRATSTRGDFIIEENKEVKGFIDVAGMKSPGLSSAPAVALEVVKILKDNKDITFTNKKNFKGKRKIIRMKELSSHEKNEIIKNNNAYGRIICRCEEISEGEIVDAIHRCFSSSCTLDEIKRRCRPLMGRCQGGFCGPKLQEIIARELKIDKALINENKEGSYILTGKTK